MRAARSTCTLWPPALGKSAAIIWNPGDVHLFTFSIAARASKGRIPRAFSSAKISEYEAVTMDLDRLVQNLPAINSIQWRDAAVDTSSFTTAASARGPDGTLQTSSFLSCFE